MPTDPDAASQSDQQPPIDPSLPGWSRGMIAVFREGTRSLRVLLSASVVTQIGVLVAVLWGGNHLDNKINDKHEDTKADIAGTTAKIAEVEKKQDVTHEKLAVTNEKLTAIKADVRKGPAGSAGPAVKESE